MKFVLIIIGFLISVAGFIWFLQGINVIPGSFMTGQTQWAVYGVIAFIIGSGLIVFAYRRGRITPKS